MTVSGSANRRFLNDEARWSAFSARDVSAEGSFVVGVKTTGIYCRPGCPARTPRRENVVFYPNCASAERAGFRECKRCRPKSASHATQQAALIADACRAMERADSVPRLSVLARSAGLSPSRFHRVFKSVTGVTPRAYATALRAERAGQSLRSSRTVTEAIYASGFGSSGRFYEAAPERLGMTPTQMRAGGRGLTIRHATGRSWLGVVLVAATDRGICAIMFGDKAEPLVRDLKERFSHAKLVAGDRDFQRTVRAVAEYVRRPAAGLELPLDIIGTAFQQQVWELLRKIPAGATSTYTEIAKRLGKPSAVRAVASACAANPISVAIPCHRVVRSDGSLAGYYWGIERKRRLLDREQQNEESPER